MYITSDLFGSRNYSDSPTTTFSHNWNTMADAHHAAGLGKRKRHMDAEEGNTTCGFQQESGSPSRGIRKVPATHSHGARHTNARASRSSPTHTHPGSRPLKQIKRTSPIISLRKLPSHLMDTDIDISPVVPNLPPPAAAANDLRACHVCHSAPKRKRDLENYLECQSCTERACYICARGCSGGCKKQLCSKCCVEVGEQGDTYCFECYQMKR